MYANHSNLFRLAVIGFILFVACPAKADPVTIEVNVNTPQRFELRLTHLAIGNNADHEILLFPNWVGKLEIMEREMGSAGSDTLFIRLSTIVHFIAPHGEEEVQGPEIVFNIDAGSFALLGMKHTEFSGPFSVTHGIHTDIYSARLDFETTSIGENHHIDRYTLTITGEHVVPEPSSLIMAGIGSLALSVYKRVARAKNRAKG